MTANAPEGPLLLDFAPRQKSAAPCRLHVFMLGSPRFAYDGKPFAFTRPRTLGLLAYLLLHRNAHLTRSSIAFALWPDESEAAARANLRRHLHLLAQALPSSDVPAIVAREDSLRWNEEYPVWFDVAAFERDIDDDERCAKAVELYAADLLPLASDEWIDAVRDRLRRRYLGALDRLLFRARSARELPRAADYAARLLEQDAWREDAVRQAATIRFESGDRAGALRVLDDFSARLDTEMGVEPMLETQALRESLVRGATATTASAGEAETGPVRGGFPFVGRATEMAALLEAWKSATCQRGQLLLVGGEAGIGKTRLVNELALFAESQGGRVLRGTTSSPEPVPYQALVETLRDAVPFVASLDVRPIWLAAAAALIPEITVVRPDLPVLPALDAVRERARLFEALVATYNALARQRPLLLLLEDLHWAGSATLDAIEYLARRASAMSALVIVTYRPSDESSATALHALRRRLQSENVSRHIALGGLAIDGIRRLAQTIPALAQYDDALASEICDASAGNPLFAGELLRERAVAPAGRAPHANLRDTLDARYKRLSESTRTMAEIASVVGATFDVDLVRAVAGWNEGDVLAALTELLDSNLAREIGRTRFAFGFTHQLIAASLYESIAPDRRKRWHARVAQVAKRTAPDADAIAATLAYHFDRACNEPAAAAEYLVAARRAFALFANQEASTAASRGLQLATETRVRCKLLALHEEIAARRGDRETQANDLAELAILAARLDDPAADADATRRLAALAHARGAFVEEAALLEIFRAYANGAHDVRLQATAACASARNAIAGNAYANAEPLARQALEYFCALGDAEGEVDSLCLLAEIAVNVGSTGAVRDLLREAHERAMAGGHAPLIARALMASSCASIMRREFPQALRDSEAALERYRDIGDRQGEAEALGQAATALGMLRRTDECRTYFAESALIYRAIGNPRKYAYVLFNQSAAEIQLGLLDAGTECLSEALRIFKELSDRRGYAVCGANQSVVALVRGQAAEAKEFAVLALADARAIGNRVVEAAALCNLGNAERELGQSANAVAHMSEAIAIREWLGRPATFEELGDFALAKLANGDVEAARTLALDILAQVPGSNENTVWPHLCVWAAARVLRACGEPARAKEALGLAKSFVTAQIEGMADPGSRAAFSAMPVVRDIVAADYAAPLVLARSSKVRCASRTSAM